MGKNTNISIGVKKSMFVLFSVILLVTSLIELMIPKTADAVGGVGFTNPDAKKTYNPDTYDYLKKSDFVKGANNKARYIRPGSRSAWYTCWGYGSSAYGFYKNYGTDDDKIFTSKYGLCNGDQKRLEYELYAENSTKNGSVKKPEVVSYNGQKRLRVGGWATLGGYGHHTSSNQSSYLVLVKQVNGADSTNENDVYITRNKNENITITGALSYLGVPMAGANEYNQFRGYGWVGAKTYGKNFRYENVGLSSYIPLDKMFSDGLKEGKYKLYLVKRVNDMIVKSEVSFPQSNFETKYGNGKLKLTGNDESKSLRANGTDVMLDGVRDNGKLSGTNNTPLGFNERVLFKDVLDSEFGVSTYWFSRPSHNNQQGENFSQYFVYGNKASYLTYVIEDVNIKVHHIDYKTKGNIYVKDSKGKKVGTKGSGVYPIGKNLNLQPYNVGKDGVTQLTNSSGTAKYVLYNPTNISTKVSKSKRDYYFNYIDINKDALVVVKYLDKATGKEIKDGYMKGDYSVGSTQKISLSKGDITYSGRNYKYLSTDSNGQNVDKYVIKKGVNQINVYFEKQPRVTVEYFDKDTNKTFKTYTEDVLKGSKYTPKAPGVINEGGKTYTRFNKGIPSSEIVKDTKLRIPYTTKSLKPRPNGGKYKEVADESKPNFDIGDMSWRLYKDDAKGLETKFNLDANISKPHPTPDGKGMYKVKDYLIDNKVNMYVGKGSVRDSGNATGKKDYFYKEIKPNKDYNYDIKELMNKGLATKHNDSKVTKYQLDTGIKYYNVMKRVFECSDGVEDRCFEWKVGNYEIYKTEGDGTPIEQNKEIDINGKKIPLVKTINKAFSVDVDTKTGKTANITETNYDSVKGVKYIIGRGGKFNDLNKASDKNINSLTNIESKVEEVYPDINAFKTILPTQQSSMLIDEKIKYKNDFSENLSEPRKESLYYIDELDKNLEESLGTKGDAKNKIELEFDKTANTYKLSKVFDISKKYGVQVMTDKKGITDAKRKANLDKELKGLSLGKDELVDNKLSGKGLSAYYLPIDDVKYKPGESNKFVDDIKLTDLGLNDINFNYSKSYWFKQYLYGNIGDNPVYTQEKRPIEDVKYKNNLTLTQDMIVDLRGKVKDRKDTYNLFRVTDDVEVSKHISK